jgi:hypothetical protein
VPEAGVLATWLSAGAAFATDAARDAEAAGATAALLLSGTAFAAEVAAGAGESINPSAISTKLASLELLVLGLALAFQPALAASLPCTEVKPGKFIEYTLSFLRRRLCRSRKAFNKLFGS